MSDTRYILTLSCNDVRGIVAAVTSFLAENHGFIIESAQFGDATTGQFFLRIEFAIEPAGPAQAQLQKMFGEKIALSFGMQWAVHRKDYKNRVLIMVSKAGHCLNDLLYRYTTAQLAIEVPAIVSNHMDLKHIADWHGIPFFLLPPGKEAQETKLRDIIKESHIDTVVLARYMQILSPALCTELGGRAINIHHSFLPSFKGAKPYHQAFDRGVKLIGATAHYVTTELDEGPIIEQEVARVDHTQSTDELVASGRDTECLALARALKYHIENRVLINGKKTVVFK